MNVSFITPTPPDISAFGIRALSAFLKKKGHTVRCIFLPGGIELLKHGGEFTYQYPESVIRQIEEIVQDSHLVGFSFMSQYRDRALQITRRIKSDLDIPVVWGGIHAEVRPEDALRNADAACVSEGEYILLELLENMENGRGIVSVPGLFARSDFEDPGKIPPHFSCPALISDLDTLPFFDFNIENQWILDPIAQEVRAVTPEFLHKALPLMPAPAGGALTVFRTMTSRGCPHRCTYCANRIKAVRYPGEQYLRFRSPDHVIRELKEVIQRFPFIQGIHFFDDVFTAMPEQDLETLCHRLKTEIGLPYYAQASPSTLTEKQLEMFVDTGLVFIELGIQTGSDRIRKMYRRPESNARIVEAIQVIHRFRSRLLTPHYHVILDNPWETRSDVCDTLNLLTRLPGRFKLCLASLTFYPGTDLELKAREEGLLHDEELEVYRKPFYIPKGRYLNYLIYLCDIPWIPGWVLRFLGSPAFHFLDRDMFGPVFDGARRMTEKLRLLGKGVEAVFSLDFARINRYLHRVR